MKNKQGITLILLIITIIIILILLGTLTVSAGNAIGNSRISALASDLKEVEDATKTYYMLNNEFPSIDLKAYNQGEIKEKVPSRYRGLFTEELQHNNDEVNKDTDGTFYLIDLAKIGIEQTTRGTMLDNNGNAYESNVYAVAYPSMNVYYLEGVRANGDVFFSLSSKITQLTKVVKKETVEDGETSLTTTSGIIVKKETDKWTNELSIMIESYVDLDETLFVQLGNGSKHKLTTVFGNNTIQLKNNFMTGYSNTTNKEFDTGITTAELNTFNSMSQAGKKIAIAKERGGLEVGKVVVSLENYENDLPGITSDINVEHQPTYNHLSFTVNDVTSGIDEVRYEYLTRIDETGKSVSYFENITSYDDEYMKSRAKKASVSSSGFVEMQLPKDIEIVQINIFDKAGNSSAKINQRLISDVYIGINETEVTTTSLKINAVAKVTNGKTINSALVQLSTDGITYRNDKSINFVNNTNAYTATTNYTGLSLVNKVYVKITLNYGNNEQYVRIKEIDVNTIKV